jgi:hypothetical protein
MGDVIKFDPNAISKRKSKNRSYTYVYRLAVQFKDPNTDQLFYFTKDDIETSIPLFIGNLILEPELPSVCVSNVVHFLNGNVPMVFANYIDFKFPKELKEQNKIIDYYVSHGYELRKE